MPTENLWLQISTALLIGGIAGAVIFAAFLIYLVRDWYNRRM